MEGGKVRVCKAFRSPGGNAAPSWSLEESGVSSLEELKPSMMELLLRPPSTASEHTWGRHRCLQLSFR